MFDIEVPNHFLPASHYKFLPCALRKPDPCKYVMGVFLSEETYDNTEIKLDLKDIYTPSSSGSVKFIGIDRDDLGELFIGSKF